MRLTPKEYIVYWTSKKVGKPNSSTETYKANSKTFDDYDNAIELVVKLHKLRRIGGQYMSRIVHHVGASWTRDGEFDNVQGPDAEIGSRFKRGVEKNIQNRLMKIIAEVINREVSEIDIDDNFFDDLGCDSLDIVELMIAVEDEFETTIEDGLENDIHTVEDLINIAFARIENGRAL